LGALSAKTSLHPSHQFEALANALEFNITDMFIDKQENNSFIALRSEVLSEGEKKA